MANATQLAGMGGASALARGNLPGLGSGSAAVLCSGGPVGAGQICRNAVLFAPCRLARTTYLLQDCHRLGRASIRRPDWRSAD